MKSLRVLHITPWYPNHENDFDGIFIAKHIEALNEFCENSVLHILFSTNKSEPFSGIKNGVSINRITQKPILNKWKIKEWLATRTISNFLKQHASDFDIVNFYIAYPNAIYINGFIKKFPQLKFTISEQWSAYHQEFNLPENHKGRKRIENIFNPSIPLFVVSNALGNDIRNFTKQGNLPYQVVPNIVDSNSFKYLEKVPSTTFTFCSINHWSPMKNPILLLDAFAILHAEHPNTRLVIAGSGQLDDEIKQRIEELKLAHVIEVKGRIPKETVVEILQSSQVYCQSSNYETFSAICIEALACGTPVIATNVGGMKDFIHPENGRLVDHMKPAVWAAEMKSILEDYSQFNSQKIALEIAAKYNASKVGQLFANHLKAVFDER